MYKPKPDTYGVTEPTKIFMDKILNDIAGERGDMMYAYLLPKFPVSVPINKGTPIETTIPAVVFEFDNVYVITCGFSWGGGAVGQEGLKWAIERLEYDIDLSEIAKLDQEKNHRIIFLHRKLTVIEEDIVVPPETVEPFWQSLM